MAPPKLDLTGRLAVVPRQSALTTPSSSSNNDFRTRRFVAQFSAQFRGGSHWQPTRGNGSVILGVLGTKGDHDEAKIRLCHCWGCRNSDLDGL
eukprot:gene14270-20244_t